MAATIKRAGVRWGANGITMTAGIVSTDNAQEVQSANMSRTCDMQELRNGIGDCVGKVFYNQKVDLSLQVIPYSLDSIAAGRTSLDSHMIPPGTMITVLDGEGASIDNANGGKYNLISARQGLTNTGMATVDLELEAYTANDVTTPVT